MLSQEAKTLVYGELREFAKEILEGAYRDFGITRDYLTIQELCKYLNVSKNTLMKWHDEKGLKIIKIDNKHYVSKEDLYDFMTQHKE
ncbi:helix-turn-helix domain-containing protein [Ignavigranum ruoffiae]|nr:helix-turn-helix domain-containing protein [Ignavigranum ruoffiae]